ncbi:MAG: GNAT family N-acetyltransferase, partial [Ruegeria sp.]
MTEHTMNSLGQPIGLPVAGDYPRSRPPPTQMKGRTCSVVQLDPELHAPGLHRAFAHDFYGRNWTYLPYGPFETESEFADWLGKKCTGTDPLFHTVLDNNGSPIGIASF